MTKIVSMMLLACLLVGVGAGCKTKRGDREYIPGQGWKPVR